MPEENMPDSPTPDKEPASPVSTIVIVVTVVVLVGGYFVLRARNNRPAVPGSQNETMQENSGGSNNQAASSPTQTASPLPSSTPTMAAPAPIAPAPAEKVFTVSGQNYSFTPSEIRVNKGDKVKIVFQNSGGMHDWVLDEFHVQIPILPSGQSATVEFTADKNGTFEYYCSVDHHRDMGMKGSLIVQ